MNAKVEYTMGGLIDGWVVDYVYDRTGNGASFAWRDPSGKIGTSNVLVINETVYLPKAVTVDMEDGHLLLPSKIGEKKTFSEVMAIIENYLSHAFYIESAKDRDILVRYVLLTWIYESMDAIPYLNVCGEGGTGKTELLKRLGLICYRFYKDRFLDDMHTVEVVDQYRGTVLLGAIQLKRSTTVQIATFIGSMVNNPMKAGKTPEEEKTFNVFGPKLIDGNLDCADPALRIRCIQLHLPEVSTDQLKIAEIPLITTVNLLHEAQEIRNILLRWKLEYQPQTINLGNFQSPFFTYRENLRYAPFAAIEAMKNEDSSLRSE